MSILIKTLTRISLLKDDLDYHLVRASMVITYFFFGYQRLVSAAPVGKFTGASTIAQIRV